MKFLTKNYLLEVVVFSAALAALDYYVFPGSLIQWNPSPLWFIVLLVAMRYGSPAGIVAGLAASASHLWVLTRIGYPLQDVLHRSPEMLAVPVLYVLVGLFLGESRERLARRGDYLKGQVDDLSHQLDSSEIKRMEVERGHLEMEKRIAGQTDTLRGVYDNLNRLNGARNEEELWEITVELLGVEMQAASCTVWETSPVKLLAAKGAAPDAPPPLVRIATKRKGIATAADWNPGAGRGKSPGAELAGLLLPDAENPVVLAVSGMHFNRLNRNTSILFELMLQRAGAVAEEIRRLNRLRRVTINDPELGLSSENYLRNRIREQALLARRHGHQLSVIACTPSRADMERTLDERLTVVTACAIRAVARASDGIAYFPPQKAFVVMLPGTGAPGARVVIDKIGANLDKLDLSVNGGPPLVDLSWGLAEFDAQGGEEAMLERLFAFDAKEGAER